MNTVLIVLVIAVIFVLVIVMNRPEKKNKVVYSIIMPMRRRNRHRCGCTGNTVIQGPQYRYPGMGNMYT